MKYSIKVIAFRPEWVEELEDMESAVFLQQLAYWSDKGSSKDGWIYKSIPEFEYETTLTDKQQRRVAKKLQENGYIYMEVRQAPDGRATRHFKLLKIPESPNSSYQDGQGPLPKGKGSPAQRSVPSITENTHRDSESKDSGSSLNSKESKNLQEEVEIETDSDGIPIKKKPAARKQKNPAIYRLAKDFADKCKKELELEIAVGAKGANLISRALNTHNLTEDKVKDLFDWWFSSGKAEEELVQITHALSDYNINKYKVNNG